MRFGNDENLNSAFLQLNSSGYQSIGGPNNIVLGHALNRSVIFSTNGFERVRIKGDGKVGIGSTNPTAILDVNGTSQFQDDVFIGVGATVGIGSTVFFGSGVRLLFGNDDYRISHDGFNSYLDSRKGDLNIRTLGAGANPSGTGKNVQIISDDEYMARFIRNSSVDLYYDNGLKFQTSGIGVTVYNQLDTTNIVASGVVTVSYTHLTLPTKA